MVLQLMAGLMMILIGAELFTNSVEWLGNRLRLPEGSVGHLLAAVGTALPESMVPLIAFMSGGIDAVDIGIGAILGAPFMLGTLAMFITGFAAWILRGRKTGRKIMHVDAVDMKRDLRFFICMYLLVIAAAFLSMPNACIISLGIVSIPTPISKFSWLRWVCAAQRRSAGTFISPIESCSILYFINIAPLFYQKILAYRRHKVTFFTADRNIRAIAANA